MYVLSVEDIDLMIALAINDTLPSEFVRHEKQMDKLIRMGIIRPGGGVLALTALGYKTANGLMGRCLGSIVDGPTQPQPEPAIPAATRVATDEASASPAPDSVEASAADNSEEGSSEATAGGDTASEVASDADSDAAAEPA